MRSVRADDEGGGRSLGPVDDDPDELTALRSFYAAKIAAVRVTMSKADRRAAIKALRDEQKAAMRELTLRRQERRKTSRDAARLRAPPQQKPKPLR